MAGVVGAKLVHADGRMNAANTYTHENNLNFKFSYMEHENV